MVLELNSCSPRQAEQVKPAASGAIGPTSKSSHLPERRREPRYPTKDPAIVDVPYERVTGLSAVVVDVSRSGLRLELKQSIARGMQVKITLSPQLAINGEVRYCRRFSAGFHAGILVHEAALPISGSDQHITEDELGFYLVGRGLSVSEIIRLKAHLVTCEACQKRLQEMNGILNPVRKPRA